MSVTWRQMREYECGGSSVEGGGGRGKFSAFRCVYTYYRVRTHVCKGWEKSTLRNRHKYPIRTFTQLSFLSKLHELSFFFIKFAGACMDVGRPRRRTSVFLGHPRILFEFQTVWLRWILGESDVPIRLIISPLLKLFQIIKVKSFALIYMIYWISFYRDGTRKGFEVNFTSL